MINYKPYIQMARPDHWFKNIFLIPGTAIALLEVGADNQQAFLMFILGFVSVCLVASANYVINEVLDRESDRHHPIKKNRPAVNQKISFTVAYAEYSILLVVGLALGWIVNYMFFFVLILLVICGLAYNVKPLRLKECAYLDVILESFNNVLRLLLGWFVVTTQYIPPSSLIISFWAAGAFLMAAKRYAEYREIGDPERARLYRKSFAIYDESKLLICSFFYAINFAFFFGLFLYKYRIEYILLYPVFAGIFTWYLRIAMLPQSAAQNPHKLFKEKRLMLMIFSAILGLFVLTFVDIPGLKSFVRMYIYS